MAGRAGVASLTHAGDRLDADFDLGRDKTVRLALQAREARWRRAWPGRWAWRPTSRSWSRHRVRDDQPGSLPRRRAAAAPLVPIAGDGAWTPQRRPGAADGSCWRPRSYLTWYQHRLGPDAAVPGHRRPGRRRAAGRHAHREVGERRRRRPRRGRYRPADGRAEGNAGGDPGAARASASSASRRWARARLTGTLSRQRSTAGPLAGMLEADAPTAFDYRLAQVRGPVKFAWGGGELHDRRDDGRQRRRRARDRRGAAGRAAARDDRARLAAGRARADQVADRASAPGSRSMRRGQRGILGGLSFKGQASFSNFAVAHPGAQGPDDGQLDRERRTGQQPVAAQLRRQRQGLRQRLGRARPSARRHADAEGAGRSGTARAIALSEADLTGAAGALAARPA